MYVAGFRGVEQCDKLLCLNDEAEFVSLKEFQSAAGCAAGEFQSILPEGAACCMALCSTFPDLFCTAEQYGLLGIANTLLLFVTLSRTHTDTPAS